MTASKNSTRKRKRVKVTEGSTLVSNKPLGIEAYPHLEKTAQELELEEAVFGFALPTKGKQKQTIGSTDVSPSKDNQASQDLAGLADDQLFMLDEPVQSSRAASPDDPEGKPKNVEANQQIKKNKSEKLPIWKDESANRVSVSLTHGPSRRKKLRTLGDADPDVDQEIRVSGEEYERRLRSQFDKMNPTPNWLKDHRQSKTATTIKEEDEDEPDFGLGLILNSTGDLNRPKLSRKNKKGSILPHGKIDITRLRDANQAEPEKTKSSISCLQFHPHSDILMTASAKSKRLSFFQIDGTHNRAVHFVHTPDLPIQAAEFCPPSSNTNNSSSTVLMTGHRPYFYTFDMKSCQCIKSPQGLFHKTLVSQSSKGTSLSHFKFSPQGNLVAFVGLNGLVELVDWSNNIGSSQIIHSLKSNTPIKSLAWNRNGTELLTIGNNAEVSIWDLRMNKILGSWLDDGGFNPTKITTSDQDSRSFIDRKYTAIGSQTGIVNIYSDDDLNVPSLSDPGGSFQVPRKPFKTIENLTTSINRLKFNPDAQVLGISSAAKKDAFKLVHLKTGTVFSNWPTSNTPLGHVADFDFSRDSKYLVTGDNRGKVLLYSLNFWA